MGGPVNKPSLLPPNSTRAELALEAAVSRDVPVIVRELWIPTRIPAPLLPWKAWGLSVDAWGVDWSDSQKRASIAVSIPVHRRKGTVHAMKSALGAMGYRTQVVEWFQESPPAPPYTFAIDIEVSDAGITEGVYLQAETIANSVKNARSHLSRVRAIARTAGAAHMGIGTTSGEVADVFPHQLPEVSGHVFARIAAGMAVSESASVFPRIV